MGVVVQATVWAERRHCQAVVFRSLKFLSPPTGDRLQRLWLASGPQRAELTPQAEGLGVGWRLLGHVPTPQYAGYAEKKSGALAGFSELLLALRDVPANADVLVVEDDIEIAPDALMRLARVKTDTGADAVTALVRASDGGWPVYRVEDGRLIRLRDYNLLSTPQPIDACGTFCLLLSARVVQAALAEYHPELTCPEWNTRGKDLHFCHWLYERGFRLALDSTTRGNHHVEIAPGQVVVRKETTE